MSVHDRPWLRQAKNGDLLLDLAVQPGAKKSEVAGLHGDRLKLKVAAPPVEGAANELLIKFLAEQLGLKKQQVIIVAGESSRLKTVQLATNDPQVYVTLKCWAGEGKN